MPACEHQLHFTWFVGSKVNSMYIKRIGKKFITACPIVLSFTLEQILPCFKSYWRGFKGNNGS